VARVALVPLGEVLLLEAIVRVLLEEGADQSQDSELYHINLCHYCGVVEPLTEDLLNSMPTYLLFLRYNSCNNGWPLWPERRAPTQIV
jgi:hypothetical protein